MQLDPQLRLVIYPALIAGDVVNRYGYFIVTYDHGKPVTATLPRMVDYVSLDEVADVMEDVLEAFTQPSLYCLNTVDLDNTEWDGTLHF
mgnify:CR=1 FL=1